MRTRLDAEGSLDDGQLVAGNVVFLQGSLCHQPNFMMPPVCLLFVWRAGTTYASKSGPGL